MRHWPVTCGAAGVKVVEVNQPDMATRRRRDKTDTLDAEAAARAVLSGRASGSAKAGDGPVEMLRMFKLALARRITEGKTCREAIRCLKRYFAREIYQIITARPEAEPSAA